MERDMSKWTDKTKPAPWFMEMTVEQRQQYGREKFMEMSGSKTVRDFMSQTVTPLATKDRTTDNAKM